MNDFLISIANQVAPSLVAWIEASKYIILFLGCIFEGPMVMIASGFLYRLGGFEFLPMYLALVSGDFAADIGWYFIGRYGARNFIFRYGHHFGVTPRIVEKIENRFQKYHEKILIISKLTMGFGFALVTLMVAGMLKVPFKKYVILNLIGGFIWTGLLVVVGYFFGNVYDMITGPEKIIFAIVVLIALIITLKLASRYLQKKEI